MLTDARAIHLCIDMQRIFAEETQWHTPTLFDIVPNIARIVAEKPGHTIFARFTVPHTPDLATGSWQTYYRRWSSLTGANLDPGMIELVEPLAALAEGEEIFDKPTYSLFGHSHLDQRLKARKADTLVITGVETDICVLATVFDAVDLGYRVILVRDAVTSSSLESHKATLELVLPRMPQQITIAGTADVIASWSCA
ncbi:cysteine hydrolase family protein [Labrys okinawensis]|uniref:cysteine hydrolase family protein n=1 Tax=Labrys okinawensis TaxID=346911 RepID=UPI0039BCF7F7